MPKHLEESGQRGAILAAGADMSSTASWTYTNVATVRPVIGLDEYGGPAFGEQYQIACTWTAESKLETGLGGQSGSRGQEFVSRHTIYTEDPRPQYGDELIFEGSDGWEKIRSRTNWDMSFFGQIPDYKLIT